MNHNFIKFISKIFSYIPKWKLFYPFYLASRLYFTEEEFRAKNLPDELEGFKICYASDIHFGSMLNKKRACELIEKINSLEPDLILLGGDFGEDAKEGANFFRFIPAIRAKHGVFACIGNHDLIGGRSLTDKIISEAQKKGVNFIINEKIKLDELPLHLSSCDDIKYGKPTFDFLKSRSGGFHIFFPHSPDVFPKILNDSFNSDNEKLFDLSLAGHTHAGQVRLFNRTLHASSKYGDRYRYSWIKERGHDIFVSSGVGTSLLPVRLGTKPEYCLFTLKKTK